VVHAPWAIRAVPSRSSSVPRVIAGSSLATLAVAREESTVLGALTPSLPAGPAAVSLHPFARVRQLPGSRTGQFIPMGSEAQVRVRHPSVPLEGFEARGVDVAQPQDSCNDNHLPSSMLARFQQALAEQRAEHEAKFAQLQAHWEERFAEVVSFWQRAWSTTNSVVKDCNAHCVKLSEVLEESLDELGQNNVGITKLNSRVRGLEASCASLPPAEKQHEQPQWFKTPALEEAQEQPSQTEAQPGLHARQQRGLSGTSDSFKRLSTELARFEQEVLAHSQKFLSLTPANLENPQPAQKAKFVGLFDLNAVGGTPADQASKEASAPLHHGTAAGALPQTVSQAARRDPFGDGSQSRPEPVIAGVMHANQIWQSPDVSQSLEQARSETNDCPNKTG